MKADLLEAIDIIIRRSGVPEYDVYKNAGVSRSTLDRWTTGRSEPNLNTLIRIAMVANFLSATNYWARLHKIKHARSRHEKIFSRLEKKPYSWRTQPYTAKRQ